MENSFWVKKTESIVRKHARGDYVICMHKKDAKELKIGKFAVVGFQIKFFGPSDIKAALKNEGKPVEKELYIHVKVIKTDELSVENMRVERGEVRIDQSIRNAIGIPHPLNPEENHKVSVYRIEMPLHSQIFYFLKYYTAMIFGFRYLFFRTFLAHNNDMEKELVRIDKDTFPVLGTLLNNKIVIEAPVKRQNSNNGGGESKEITFEIKRLSISAFELTDSIKQQRASLEKLPSTRYLNPLDWMKVNPNISQVFMDEAIRSRLGVDQLDPVKARRNITNLLKSQILSIGLFFLISVISISGVFFSDQKDTFSIITTLLIGISATVVFLFILLRSQIR